MSESDKLSDDTNTVESINLNSGDVLIVEERALTPEKEQKKTGNESEYRRHAAAAESVAVGQGILLKKVVPSDNSCLFTSVGFVLSGEIDVTCGSYMREIIAEAIASDPDNYNEAILGLPNHEYCQWIKRSESWGGAIELAILSKHYGIEIAVVDAVNAIINRFGEDQNYDHRVFLIYDGVHYDPLYLEPYVGGDEIQTVFSTSDGMILTQAEVLAIEAQASGEFTDVNHCPLRCLDCNNHFVGQKEALDHAKETGHKDFAEITQPDSQP